MGGSVDSDAPVRVRAWVVEVDSLGRDVLARLEAVLDEGERATMYARRREGDRRDYCAAHGLLRFAIAPDAPEAVRVAAGANGRPVLASPARPPRDVSLSHAAGVVAVAVADAAQARAPRVGVDVEAIQPLSVVHEISDRVLSTDELAALRALEPAAQRRRFAALWTLKEAHVKCTGEGMSAPLTRITFDVEGDGRLVEAPGLDPSHVHTRSGDAGDSHRWAVVAHARAPVEIWVHAGPPPLT